MTIYAIIAPQGREDLTAAVRREFPNDHLEFAPGQFLVSAANSFTSEIKERLGISDGMLGRVLVLAMFGAAGWHRQDVWEWIAQHEARNS